MPLLRNPLPLPLAQLGVTPRMFLRPSDVHGPSHVNRVMFIAMALARTMGWAKEYGAAVWAAVHLHDLARTHDGVCHEHGRRAVQHFLPHFLPLYRAGGLTGELLPHVITAVTTHCMAGELPPDHPHIIVTNLLKDADGLDRVRINDLDPSYLRLERSPRYVTLAEDLFAQFGNNIDVRFEDIWNFGLPLLNPVKPIADLVPDGYDETEEPQRRRNRRLAQGIRFRRACPTQNAAINIDHEFWDYTVPAEEAFARLFAKNSANPRAALMADQMLRHILPGFQNIVSRMIPVTCTRQLAAFHRDGEYKSFWEAGPTWHYRFTDDPISTRRYFDGLLYGEVGRHIVHGVLIDPEAPEFLPNLNRLRAMYGPHVLCWRRSILEGCTFSPNDSMDNVRPFVSAFSDENLIKAITALTFLKQGIELPRGIYPWPRHLNFWEFQAHAILRPSDLMPAGTYPLLDSLPPVDTTTVPYVYAA